MRRINEFTNYCWCGFVLAAIIVLEITKHLAGAFYAVAGRKGVSS